MTAAPLVRGSAYLPFVHFMENVGAAAGRSPAHSLLPAVVTEDPEVLVPIHLAHEFLDRCARLVGLPALGYVVGRDMRVESLGAFGRSVLRSLTLRDALGKIRTKFPLYSSAEKIWWTRSGDNVCIFHSYVSETGPGSRYARQCVLLLFRDLIRIAAGPTWQPAEVLSPEALSDADAIRSVFGDVRIKQSEYAGMVFPARLLGEPWDKPRVRKLHDSESEDRPFENSAPAGDFAGSIKQVIYALMKHDRCDLAQTARAVGMHPRTLQRRLSDCDRDYSELLAEVRFTAAMVMISDPGVRVIDIAGELGYADSANFTRAFRQWTGTSPTKYRSLCHEDVVVK